MRGNIFLCITSEFMKQTITLTAFIFSFITLFSQTPLQQFISAENLSSAGISLLIRDIKTGEDVVEHNANTARTPASLVKVITTATALELLTDTFQFQTRIEYDGTITPDSVLNGNIYIVGGGDPTLESTNQKTPSNFYPNTIEAIQKAGIRKINGQIIGDASLFEEYGAPCQWLVEDIGTYYSPSPSALSIFDNLLYITLQSDSFDVRLEKTRPPSQRYIPNIEIKTGSKEIAWRSSNCDFSWQPTIRGVMPINNRITVRTEIPEPALLAADSLYNLLIDSGIPVSSAPTTIRAHGKNNKTRNLIYTYYSAPLRTIISETNYRSINLNAENIFLYLALQRDSIATYQEAAAMVSSYWEKKGLPVKKIFQIDGSGLSLKNAINAEFFVQLLIYMKEKAKYRKTFFASLPTAGVSGTVSSFLAGTSLSGKVYAKSGSMDRVQNYCGYIQHKDKWYAFCIMVNNYTGERNPIRKQISDLLNKIFAN